MKPGIYPGLAMAEYLAAEAVSATLLKAVIEECPRAAWWRSWMNPHAPARTSDAAQGAGTIAHACLLEGSTDCVQVIDPNDHPAEKTGNIPEGWTNKSIRTARDQALNAGKVPVFPSTMAVIEAMVAAAREFIESLRESEPAIWAAFQPSGGESEVTLVWEDNGTLCRIRPDRISTDRRIIVDYKTGGTSAEPDTWGRAQMVRMGYYTSAAFYRRGAQAAFGVTPDYVFLVQEQEAPYLCSLVGIDPAGCALGERRIARALRTWKACANANSWPGYPTRVCYVEIPPWEHSRDEAIEVARGNPYDYGKMGWKKPPASKDDAMLDQVFDAMPDDGPMGLGAVR
jgi:hypothetical protein